MRFRNPANGYIEESTHPWLWTLLFGGFYFAYKGIWRHFVIGILLSGVTLGIAWLIYPFFARDIVRNNYLRNGWIEEIEPARESQITNPDSSRAAIVFWLMIAFISAGIFVRSLPSARNQSYTGQYAASYTASTPSNTEKTSVEAWESAAKIACSNLKMDGKISYCRINSSSVLIFGYRSFDDLQQICDQALKILQPVHALYKDATWLIEIYSSKDDVSPAHSCWVP